MGERKNNTRSSVKSVKDLSSSFDNGYASLYGGIGIASHKNDMNSIDAHVDSIISATMNNTKAITSDEMSTFLVKLFNDQDRNYDNGVKTIDDIFQNDDNSITSFFQDRYQNQNLLYDDLNMICAHLAELEEAVLTTRDAIVTADDISRTVSRTIYFEDTMDSDENIDNYRSIIEAIETDLSLPKKIKNQIITNGLKYGKYFVYTVPYTELFEQQYRHKLENPTLSGTVKESLQNTSCISLSDVVCENSWYADLKKEIKSVNDAVSSTEKDLRNLMETYCADITVTNDIYSIPLIEGTDITQIMTSEEFKKTVDSIEKSRSKKDVYSDSVIDIEKKVRGKFDKIHDCYVKFIDPRKVIPVKILDTTLGYYYIHECDLKRDKAPFSTTIRLTNNAGTGSYSDDIESIFMSRITDRIIAAFDPKFVEKNAKFKDLIINALVYNNIYSKRLNFQFIPAEYMVEINVNEDENGEGQSILMRSLFYAKLYLALLVFKLITIITRSNDTRVYYVKNGGIDTNITNKIQDVARSIKSKQVNFMDLLNYNSIISKIGAYKDVYMPVGRSGERGIEFDTIAGQQVDLNSELMEFLRTNMINGTGVPSVIMNYINEADYAKTLQMANSKFVNRVLNLQLDFNPGLTKLYQNILRYSNTTIPNEYIDKLRYILNPPKALNAQNNADNINTTDQLIMALIKSRIGENANTDRDNIIRDIMYDALAREYMPSFDWDHIDEIYKNAKLIAEQTMAENSEE